MIYDELRRQTLQERIVCVIGWIMLIMAIAFIISLVPDAIDTELEMREQQAAEHGYRQMKAELCANNPNDPECSQ